MDVAPRPTLDAALTRLASDRSVARILAGLASPDTRAEVGGLCGSAISLFLAAIQREAPRFTLVVTPGTEEAEDLQRDLAFLLEDEDESRVGIFPAWGNLAPGSLASAVLDQRVLGRRFRVLRRLLDRPPAPTGDESSFYLVTPVQALLEDIPTAASFGASRFEVRVGDDLDRDDFAARLAELEFERVPLVEGSGEFSIRGEIVDVFPFGAEQPIRLELFGETVESIRRFDLATQRSVDSGDTIRMDLLRRSELVTGGMSRTRFHGFLEELGLAPAVVILDPPSVRGRVDRLEETDDPPHAGDRWREFETAQEGRSPVVSLHRLPVATGSCAANFHTREVDPPTSREVPAVIERLTELAALPTDVWVFCQNEAVEHRFAQLLPEEDASLRERVRVEVGELMHGFVFPELGITLISHGELFSGSHRRRPRARVRARRRNFRPIENFLDLEIGDLVVHLVHGIAKYSGLEVIDKNGSKTEYHKLTFKNEVLLYVPVSKTDLIQKYVGVKGHRPQLSKLGGKGFSKKKKKVAEAIADFAAELLEVQALRSARKGLSFPPDSVWQHEFEAAFPYEETDDQLEASGNIKENQESDLPMDRLICGDVGYGKTELAMRAAFKVVEAGRQVAVLVPTTVLAQQHYDTFRERMADFPVVIEMLSRFRTGKEQRDILGRAAEGKVDILIGTHRIVSEDVSLPNLGLVVIDEEQRFGVAHKQKFKELKATVDVLTLSATPIPRTLHMALVGLRDISTLSTPPRGRQAVHTEILAPDPDLVRDAIRRELDRDGQVYFLHNRVKTIEKTTRAIQALVPEARCAIAHGQMNEHMLEEQMLAFIEHRVDVLVCTTIIESGLDIPNVNTIFIDDAQRFGLAELHQLRGRVGRYNRQAYAYLIVPKEKPLSDVATRRLRAIQEYNDLGAGFRIAMRDLEIRGAGNILGAEQHGQIAAVGYDLYCKILARAVERIKSGETVMPRPVDRGPMHDPVDDTPRKEMVEALSREGLDEDVEVDLPGAKFLPDEYVPDMRGRMEVYRKLSAARSLAELAEVVAELRDRYGPPPAEVEELMAMSRIREACRGTGITGISSPTEGLVIIRVHQKAEALASLPLPRGAKRMVAVDPVTVHLHPAKKGPAVAIGVAPILEDLLGVREAPEKPPREKKPAESPKEPSRGSRRRRRQPRSKMASGSKPRANKGGKS